MGRLRRLRKVWFTGNQAILNFANASEINPSSFRRYFREMVTPGTTATLADRAVLAFSAFIVGSIVSDHQLTFGGRPVQDWKDPSIPVRQLRDCIRRALVRHLKGHGDPLVNPETCGLDFVVNGRLPSTPVPASVANGKTSLGAFRIVPFGEATEMLVYDIQDVAYLQLVRLLRRLQYRQPLREDRNPSRHSWEVRFQPLARCASLTCRRFFFQSRRDKTSCSRTCKDRLAHTRR
jgi:hypothetical protein